MQAHIQIFLVSVLSSFGVFHDLRPLIDIIKPQLTTKEEMYDSINSNLTYRSDLALIIANQKLCLYTSYVLLVPDFN